MLNAFAVAFVVCVGAIVVFGLRADLGEIPMWLSWGCSVAQLAAAGLLIALALREAVPGMGLPTRTAVIALFATTFFQLAVGFLTWRFSPFGAAHFPVANGAVCMRHEALLALPTLAATLWLVFRAYPLRAWMAGLLGGVGSAIASDAVTHLQCPVSDIRHVLLWHSGAIVLVGLAGAAIGLAWGRFRG
jgi:hypothetical protein